MDQQVHPERKEQGQPRIITAGKGRTGRYRHQQNQFFGSHGGKPQGGDPVEMREHAVGELRKTPRQQLPVAAKPRRKKEHLLGVMEQEHRGQRPQQQPGKEHAVRPLPYRFIF